MKKNRVNILLAALTMSMAVTATGCGTKREEHDVMDHDAAVLEEADTQIEETETAEAEIQSMETEDVLTKSEKSFETELNSNKAAVSDSAKNKQDQVSVRKKPSNGKKNTGSEKNKMSVSGATDSAKDTAASDGKQNQPFPEEKESRPEPVPDMPSSSEDSDVNISISIPEQTPAQEPIAPVPDQNGNDGNDGNDASEAPAAPDYNYSTEGLPPKPDPEEENDWEKSELPVIPGVEFNTN